VAPLVGGLLNDHISPHAVWHGGLIIGTVSAMGLVLLARKNGSLTERTAAAD